MKQFTTLFTTLLMTIGLSTSAHAVLIDFNSLSNGEIVTTQFAGVTISADNPNRSFDFAIAFDSTATGTEDPDLEDPWSGGNLLGTDLGNLLIISERSATNPSGHIARPDDEGRRPAGTIEFTFDVDIDKFGFDFVDVDNRGSGREDPSEYKLEFFDDGGLVGAVTLKEFETAASVFFDPTIDHGDNKANRYAPITAAHLGGVFDEVVVHFGGSGAIDNIYYTHAIPEPATIALFSTGLVGAYLRRRKQK